ncbi:MAG: pgdA 6 [Bacillales bacterium]|jgi:polysaccharide deacetylase family protein (PEP-CTERM system associated)|nr:pgdA 6 [Bacillales bacterium]
MLNALTVDVEDWYHTSGLDIPRGEWDHLKSTVFPNTIKLLNLFDEFKVKATFFILGDVARRYPSLITEIVERGHEIGGHSMNHQLISKQTFEEFKVDFQESVRLLESITNQKIRYFRAPSWSISSDKLEILHFLEQNGIQIDSSLQPFKTPLSGINGIPLEPFIPILNNKKMNLIEFPPTVIRLSKKCIIPFAGGFYLRFFPYKVIKYLLNKVNLKRTGMVYIHPWELNADIPKRNSSLVIKFIQYYNLSSTEGKLRKLLTDFNFAPIGQVIKFRDIKHKHI